MCWDDQEFRQKWDQWRNEFVWEIRKTETKSGTNSFWIPHNEENCQVCELYIQQSHPGRKEKHMGRPKEKGGELQFDLEKGNILSYLFDEIPDIRVESCELLLAEHKKDNFTCQLCKDIFHVRTVSTGCHYYCASCLSDMFLVNRMNNISCPECKQIIDYKAVHATDQHFRNALMDLEVMCTVCRYIADYKSLLQHVCHKFSSPTETVTSSHTFSLPTENSTLEHSLSLPAETVALPCVVSTETKRNEMNQVKFYNY